MPTHRVKPGGMLHRHDAVEAPDESAIGAFGIQGPETQLPGNNPDDLQQAVPVPAIGGQAGFDLIRIVRSDNQKNLSGALERAAEQDKSFRLQSVHKIGMGAPVFLFLEGPQIIPSRTPRQKHGEDA
jgi:hypothetical protein